MSTIDESEVLKSLLAPVSQEEWTQIESLGLPLSFVSKTCKGTNKGDRNRNKRRTTAHRTSKQHISSSENKAVHHSRPDKVFNKVFYSRNSLEHFGSSNIESLEDSTLIKWALYMYNPLIVKKNGYLFNSNGFPQFDTFPNTYIRFEEDHHVPDSESSPTELEEDLAISEFDVPLISHSECKDSVNLCYSVEDLPLEFIDIPEIEKYWAQRYRLFSRFDEGIRIDYEGWYSVTPEAISKHIADRCRCKVLVDAFCGVGGNTIQFAQTCDKVIAVDIHPYRLEMARHNCKVYGVEDKVEFIHGDFLDLVCSGRLSSAEVVFLGPPWGGPDYLTAEEFDLETMIELPINGIELFRLVENSITPNIAYLLPRNVNLEQASSLSQDPNSFCELEHNYINRKVKTITGYYGSHFSYSSSFSFSANTPTT